MFRQADVTNLTNFMVQWITLNFGQAPSTPYLLKMYRESGRIHDPSIDEVIESWANAQTILKNNGIVVH